MSSTENHSAQNLIKVRAAMSRRKVLASLRKARAVRAAQVAADKAAYLAKVASAAKAREVLAWQRRMGVAA